MDRPSQNDGYKRGMRRLDKQLSLHDFPANKWLNQVVVSPLQLLHPFFGCFVTDWKPWAGGFSLFVKLWPLLHRLSSGRAHSGELGWS